MDTCWADPSPAPGVSVLLLTGLSLMSLLAIFVPYDTFAPHLGQSMDVTQQTSSFGQRFSSLAPHEPQTRDLTKDSTLMGSDMPCFTVGPDFSALVSLMPFLIIM
jgi:hypothetical protein